MILIEKDIEKDIYLTLSPTTVDFYFLFEFISKVTGEKVLMITPNVSTAGTYQKFLFKHNGTDPNIGGFILDVGDYDYRIYGTSTYSRDIEASNHTIGVGLMRIMLPKDIPYNLEDKEITFYNG